MAAVAANAGVARPTARQTTASSAKMTIDNERTRKTNRLVGKPTSGVSWFLGSQIVMPSLSPTSRECLQSSP
jgi:hypothetical protein